MCYTETACMQPFDCDKPHVKWTCVICAQLWHADIKTGC